MTVAQEAHLSIRTSVHSEPSCNFAKLQQCNIATLQLCSIETLQLCNIATLHHCNFATLQLCSSGGGGGPGRLIQSAAGIRDREVPDPD